MRRYKETNGYFTHWWKGIETGGGAWGSFYCIAISFKLEEHHSTPQPHENVAFISMSHT